MPRGTAGAAGEFVLPEEPEAGAAFALPYLYGSRLRPMSDVANEARMARLGIERWTWAVVPEFPHGGLRTNGPLDPEDVEHFDLVQLEPVPVAVAPCDGCEYRGDDTCPLCPDRPAV